MTTAPVSPDRVAKQVIVMRIDLGMRKGKMIAQGAHASIAFLTQHGETVIYRDDPTRERPNELRLQLTAAQTAWIKGRFTKICVRADSEEQLLEIAAKAQDAGLPIVLITDAGLTEFHGTPTLTCAAIGPAWEDEIDPVTGDLVLL